MVINDWLTDIDWPDDSTCLSYSVRRETLLEDLVNNGLKFTHSTISATLYSQQWVKMYHIFDDQIMITLVTFYAPGCLLALWECEWILEISTYFNNRLIFVTLSFRIFCLSDVHPYARQKGPSNITLPFPESYRTLPTCFSRYYRLLLLKGTAATFNYYAFFFHSRNCTIQQ